MTEINKDLADDNNISPQPTPLDMPNCNNIKNSQERYLKRNGKFSVSFGVEVPTDDDDDDDNNIEEEENGSIVSGIEVSSNQRHDEGFLGASSRTPPARRLVLLKRPNIPRGHSPGSTNEAPIVQEVESLSHFASSILCAGSREDATCSQGAQGEDPLSRPSSGSETSSPCPSEPVPDNTKNNINAPSGPTLTLEQREQAYEEARRRIFGSPASGTDTSVSIADLVPATHPPIIGHPRPLRPRPYRTPPPPLSIPANGGYPSVPNIADLTNWTSSYPTLYPNGTPLYSDFQTLPNHLSESDIYTKPYFPPMELNHQSMIGRRITTTTNPVNSIAWQPPPPPHSLPSHFHCNKVSTPSQEVPVISCRHHPQSTWDPRGVIHLNKQQPCLLPQQWKVLPQQTNHSQQTIGGPYYSSYQLQDNNHQSVINDVPPPPPLMDLSRNQFSADTSHISSRSDPHQFLQSNTLRFTKMEQRNSITDFLDPAFNRTDMSQKRPPEGTGSGQHGNYVPLHTYDSDFPPLS